MKLNEFQEKAFRFCSQEGLQEPVIIERRITTLKLRISLSNGFIDLFYNEVTETINSALIWRGRRVFGINGYPKKQKWHMHPIGRRRIHAEVRSMTVEEILRAHIEAAKAFEREKGKKRRKIGRM